MIEDLQSTFFSLKADQITLSLLHDLFVTDPKGTQKVAPNTKIVLDGAKLREHHSDLLKFKGFDSLIGKETTVGRILLNLRLYSLSDTKYRNEQLQAEPYQVDCRPLLTYKNITLTGGAMGGLYTEICDLFISKTISGLVMEQFIDNINWIGFILIPYLNPSLDIRSVSASKEMTQMKNEVLSRHKDIIDSNDVKAFNNVIEAEVVKKASDMLDAGHSSGKIIYDSGTSSGSLANNFKITALFRGVVPKSDDPTQYKIGLSSLTGGVSKNEITLAGDIAVQGSIGRAIATRQGGYLVKQFNAAFQSIVADEKGTDCGTSRTMEITLSDKDYKGYLLRYVVDGGKIVQLTEEVKSRFANKPIRLRTPFYCQTTKICNICVGDMVHRLGIKNIGLTTSNIGSSLMNASLKAFHSLAVKTASYNLADFLSEA